MKVVIDANYFIDKELPYGEISEGFIPSSVEKELRDKSTEEFYKFYNFNITVRDPLANYVAEVKEAVKDKHYNVSEADIDVIALVLEISEEISNKWIDASNLNAIEEVFCLSKDNGIKSALTLLGLYEDPAFKSKKYKLRCFTCYKLYDEDVDFCKMCGYPTITRVTVIEENGVDKIMFSNNFKYRPKILKDRNGTVIRTEDQKEYKNYLRIKKGNTRGSK